MKDRYLIWLWSFVFIPNIISIIINGFDLSVLTIILASLVIITDRMIIIELRKEVKSLSSKQEKTQEVSAE